MNTKHMDFALAVKSVSDDGLFTGYASVFEELDSYRDVVKPGAFQKSLSDWREKGRSVPILWQHDGRAPIGVYTEIREDSVGLYVEGRLNLDVQQGREAYALLKQGALSGISIGYSVVRDETDSKSGVRRLFEVRLYEASLVTFPAADSARVSSVKVTLQEGELPTLRQFEKALREQGFSKAQAEMIAAHGFKHLIDSGEPGGREINAVRQALEVLKS